MQKGKFRFELQRASVNIIRKVVYPSPIDISKDEIHADGETLLENKVVALRHPRQMKIFKLAAIVEKNMRKFFDENGFTQINSPKIIQSSKESTKSEEPTEQKRVIPADICLKS